MRNDGHFGEHLESVHSDYKLNARNGLLMRITIRKVVLHDILRQIVQKLGFIICCGRLGGHLGGHLGFLG